MGTRSLTVMLDTEGKEIAVLYRQFDGYPEGHGKDLAEFLSGFKVVNGITEFVPKVANGGNCLAAQVVAHFKKEVGGFYLYPYGTRDVGEEYIYIVAPSPSGGIKITVLDVHSYPKYVTKVLWEGNVNDFKADNIKEQE